MAGEVLQLPHNGRTILVRVDHAALYTGDLVEIGGQQLARDGMPLGRIWLTCDVRDLPAAVVGRVTLPNQRA